MPIDRTIEHLQRNATFDVDREDLSHCRLSIVVPDDHEVARDRDEAAADIDEPGPEAPVVGHVHEVDSDVDRRGVHVAQRLGVGPSPDQGGSRSVRAEQPRVEGTDGEDRVG